MKHAPVTCGTWMGFVSAEVSIQYPYTTFSKRDCSRKTRPSVNSLAHDSCTVPFGSINRPPTAMADAFSARNDANSNTSSCEAAHASGLRIRTYSFVAISSAWLHARPKPTLLWFRRKITPAGREVSSMLPVSAWFSTTMISASDGREETHFPMVSRLL